MEQKQTHVTDVKGKKGNHFVVNESVILKIIKSKNGQ